MTQLDLICVDLHQKFKSPIFELNLRTLGQNKLDSLTWSKKYTKCTNCLTTLFGYKGHGLCTSCYRVKQEIDSIQNADDLELFYYKYLSVRDIAEVRKLNLGEQRSILEANLIDKKIGHLLLYGKIENEIVRVDILLLERIFNEIARRITKKPHFFRNGLMVYNTHFNEKIRKIVALNLLKMLVKSRH